MLRVSRHWIWTRAKHPDGLERPHFWTRFRGQSETWGRSSPRGDSFRCFARVFRRILRRNMCRKWVNKVKEVIITLYILRITNFFTRCSAYAIRPQAFAMTTSEKVAEKERSKRAGAIPGKPLGGSSPKKWGAPARLGTAR